MSRLLLSEIYFGKGLLLESSVAEIQAFQEEFSFEEGDFNFEEALGTAFELIYEIEYKYSMLLNKEFSGVEQRKYNILEILEDSAENLINEVAKTFKEVFEEWLKSHALLNPRMWAEARVEEEAQGYLDRSVSTKYIWQNLKSEYVKHKFDKELSRETRERGLNRVAMQNIMSDAQKNLGKMPALKDFISRYSEDEKSMMYDELESEGYEEFGERWGKEFKSEEEAREFVDDYEPDPRDSYIWQDLEAFESLVMTSEEILTELYEYLVFPLWYGKWKAEGIDETRRMVEEAYNLIEKIPSLPANKKFGALNHIINVNHQTGSMMQYYESRYHISEEFLNDLSNKDTSEWNEELREIGVKV